MTLFFPWSTYFHPRRHFSCFKVSLAKNSWTPATSNRLKLLKIVPSAGLSKEQQQLKNDVGPKVEFKTPEVAKNSA